MLILYTTEDGKSQIELRTEQNTVWLSQRQMAELFDVSQNNVGLYLKNIYEDGKLSREATTEESSVIQKVGNREVRRPSPSRNTRSKASSWRTNAVKQLTQPSAQTNRTGPRSPEKQRATENSP